MRTRVILAVLLGLFLAVPSAAREKKPSERYAEKEAAFLRAIAAKFVWLGDEARKMKLFFFAREAYQEALEYEANNRAARKILGYVRRGREWHLDPSEARKLPEQNQKSDKMLQSEFNRLVKAFEEKKADVGIYVAKKYAGLGKWCAKEGLDEQAKKAFEKSIKFDPDNEDARHGLGYTKVDGKWYTEKQLRALQEAREGRLVNESPSRFEGPLGLRLNKMESAHFRIETVMSVEALREYVKKCEQAYAYFLRDVGEEELTDIWGGRKTTFLVLAGVEQWHRYVDTFGGGSQKEREFTKQCKGTQSPGALHGAQYEGEDGGIATTVDGLVHKTAHFLVWHYWHIRPAWLQEGFAYYYTVKVLDSTQTHCVALGGYDNPAGGFKDWGDSQNWKELIKKEVVEHADPDLRVFHAMTTATLPYNASVKAWSMISWLFDKHREKFMQWLVAVGQETEQAKAFEEIFGWMFEEVDEQWRAYVKENY
jgi:tetratricopeptide (TPR) repeat protein